MCIRDDLHVIGKYQDLINFADGIIADYDQVWHPNLENIQGVMYLTLLYTGNALPLTKIYMTIYDNGNKLFVCDAIVVKGPQMTEKLYYELLKSLYKECLSKYEGKYPVKIMYGTREA